MVIRSQSGGSGALTWDTMLGANIRGGGATFIDTLERELEIVAQEMESFAKTNHPWQNQTGDAERYFTVRVVDGRTIEARHGVHYGVWLEFKHGGRWGIIPATLQHGSGRIRGAYQKAWSASWRY